VTEVAKIFMRVPILLKGLHVINCNWCVT